MQNVDIVITSIGSVPSEIISYLKHDNISNIWWVEDLKSPIQQNSNIRFITMEEQKNGQFASFGNLLPLNHYARKNIGYLYASRSSANSILDTDDDNFPTFPYVNFPTFDDKFKTLKSESNRLNVYKYFTDAHIWPRGMGFPLPENNYNEGFKRDRIGAWQGLADVEPDVDAIYRLAELSNVTFEKRGPVTLTKETWCPFNSQNTLWPKSNIALCYIPSTVTFRFCDILRGYVAQKIMWSEDQVLGFSEANVYQKRNEHNLIEDLKSELIMYEQIPQLMKCLTQLKLTGSINEKMIACYKALAEIDIVKTDELPILDEYIKCIA